MRGVRIRTATARDLDVLVAQRRSMFEEMRHRTPREHAIGDRAYRMWARRLLRRGELTGFLAQTRDGLVVAGGCVWLRPVQPGPGHPEPFEPYLLSMYTAPAYRGRGLATRIVAAAVAWAKRRGYRHITLHASRAGRPLYRELGWKRGWEMQFKLSEGHRWSKGARRTGRRKAG